MGIRIHILVWHDIFILKQPPPPIIYIETAPVSKNYVKLDEIIEPPILGPLLLTWFNFNPSMDK